MASIPSPIRKWVRRYITGEGSSEIADQSPVQSVNSQTGNVTISTGGGVIPSSQTVASYSDLPATDRSEAEIWFVTGENDIVASTQLSPVVWRSVSDFAVVVADIPDSGLTHHYVSSDISAADGDNISSRPDSEGTDNQSGSGTYVADAINGEPGVKYKESNSDSLSATFGSNVSEPYHVFIVGYLTDSRSDFDYILDGGSQTEIGFGRDNNTDDYVLFDGTTDTNGGSPDQTAHIFDVLVDSTSSIAVVDGTTIIGPRDHDGSPLTGLTTGQRADDFGYSDFVDCESAVYDASDANFSASDVRSYLSDKYSITV